MCAYIISVKDSQRQCVRARMSGVFPKTISLENAPSTLPVRIVKFTTCYAELINRIPVDASTRCERVFITVTDNPAFAYSVTIIIIVINRLSDNYCYYHVDVVPRLCALTVYSSTLHFIVDRSRRNDLRCAESIIVILPTVVYL